MDKPNIVVDASVIAKWMLSDEDDAAFALQIKEDFVQKRILISLPTFAMYEINNLLRSAVHRQRMIPLYTADKKLIEKVKSKLVRSIYSYRSSAKHN